MHKGAKCGATKWCVLGPRTNYRVNHCLVFRSRSERTRFARYSPSGDGLTQGASPLSGRIFFQICHVWTYLTT